jgi:hypothetical protein
MAATRQRNKDRRSARRYDLSLPITVHKFLPQQAEALAGLTRDISIRGVYFTTDHELMPGWKVDFTLRLPAEITHGTEVFIRARGNVVRAEKKKEDSTERAGVAAVIEKYEVVRAKPSLT